MYLARFGYLEASQQNPSGISSGALISGESVRRAIVDFQSFAGLNQTGESEFITKLVLCNVIYTAGSADSVKHL
jgi:hypothetical protein